MVSCSGWLVQSCCGEGGALQTDIAVWGEHSPCSGHTGFAPCRGVCALPVYTAQAPGCSIWSGPCVACSSSFRVLQKRADSVGPSPAGAAQAARSLPGALSPGAVHLPRSAGPASVSTRASPVCAPCVYSPELASSHDPPGGCRPSRISGSLLLETGGLSAVWEGVPSLGLSLPLSSPPCLLPLVGLGWSAVG